LAFPSADFEKLFDPFFSTKFTGPGNGGNGLGEARLDRRPRIGGLALRANVSDRERRYSEVPGDVIERSNPIYCVFPARVRDWTSEEILDAGLKPRKPRRSPKALQFAWVGRYMHVNL